MKIIYYNYNVRINIKIKLNFILFEIQVSIHAFDYLKVQEFKIKPNKRI